MALTRLMILSLLGALSVAALVFGASTPRQAAAAASISPLQFSNSMTSDYQAVDPKVEFSSGNEGVFVTFTFQDLPRDSVLTRIVRFNRDDYNWDSDFFGFLNCCPNGGSGRYGFPVVRRSNAEIGELPGGAYEVRIYLNGAEVVSGGFGIKGDDGGDSDNDDQQDNDSDND